MQKFYKDKAKLFECNISVDGANLNETKARLILEFPNNRNLLFHGSINKSGKCEIVVPALKELDECEGKAVLEIIAESTFFESWHDNFMLETNKKVVVEMVERDDKILENTSKPKVQVMIESTEIDEQTKLDVFKKYVNENHHIGENSITKKMCVDLLKEYRVIDRLNNQYFSELLNEINENYLSNKKFL
jgi:hypothetical protein